MADTYDAWSGHVIVCGLDGVAVRTVEQLHLSGVRVLVVDEAPDPRLVRTLSAWGVPNLVGGSRTAQDLAWAGIDGAVAVICGGADELHALETAMLVHELRPELRVVIQLANAAVGRAVIGVTGNGSVLDVASLSAPTMVESCLPGTTPHLALDGVEFIVADVPVERSSTLRELFRDLAPIAVVPAGTTDVIVCPGRDVEVGPGDVVTLVGAEQQFEAVGVSPAGADVPAARRLHHRPLQVARQWIASIVAEADRSLRAAVVALLLIVVVATTVLHLAYRAPARGGMSILDGIYFTVESISTIGYGDFNFSDQAPWLRVFAIGLMIASSVIMAVFYALFINLLVSRRIEESLGRRQLTGLVGHVIVIGLGSVGLRVVEGILARGRSVVVIERDDNNRYLVQARGLGVPILIADATLPQTLEAANLDTCAAVAVMTSDDLVNIESGLAVRDALGGRWDDVPVVIRLFDRDLGRSIERNFGFRHVRSTSALAAPWFVGAALGLDVLRTFYVEQQPFLLGKLTVAAGGGLDGLAMRELSARTRVVAIRRVAAGGALEYPPRRDTRFSAADEAYVVGPYEELLQVLRRDTLSPAQALGPDASAPVAEPSAPAPSA